MRQGAVLWAAFAAAVFAGVYLLPVELWLPLGLAALLPAAWFLWRKQRPGVLIALGVSAALLWCAGYRQVMLVPAEALDGRRAQVTVVAAEEAAENDYSCSLPCYLTRQGVPIRAVLYGGEALADIRPGDTLTLTADCTCPILKERKWAFGQASSGVFITLRARSSIALQRAAGAPWWSLPRVWGQRLARSVKTVFPEDVSGLIAAMTAGERSGISDSDRTALTRAGLAHLLAVSGMHISFLVGLLTLFTGADPRRRAVVCLPVVIVFALAVGGSPSVLRACVIWTFTLLAPALGRETDRWSSLAAALALLLLLDPLSAANVGLQLSFASVAGITLVTPRLAEWLDPLRLPEKPGAAGWKRLLRRGLDRLLAVLRGTLAATLGALVFTIPLTAYYFGALSLAAPLSNVLALPVAAVVFALGLVTGLVGVASPAVGAAMGHALAWPARYVMGVARAVGGFPYSTVTLNGSYYPAFLLGAYALLLIAVLWRGERRRWWVFVLCGGVMLGTSVLLTRLAFRAGDLTVAVLDVGQGQSVVLASAGETALIDCGGSGPDDPGDVAADYLLSRGETRLDKLILTHYHDDHVNGLAALFDRLDIGTVILPRMEEDGDSQLWVLGLAEEEGAEVVWIDRDETAALGGAALQLFAPLGSGDANEKGLSVLASAGDFDVLVTGDMGATVEERLVKYHRLPRCEVLVAGHHGSNRSNGTTLLEAIRPQTVLISVGENAYGHPHPDTLDRLRSAGAEVYRTDLSGTLTVTAVSGGEGG